MYSLSHQISGSFLFLSELNKCSLFSHTSAITVCFPVAKLLQGSHQQPSQLCPSLRVILKAWGARQSSNLVKGGGLSSSICPPPPPSPSCSLTSPNTFHRIETESVQVSVLFTWTLGNVKVCLVWSRARTISFLTSAWFTWPLLALYSSVSVLKQRPRCVWLMQRAFSPTLSSSIPLHYHSLSLPSLNGPLWKEVLLKSSLVCTANSNVPSSNMVLRESLSRSAGRYHFCPVELFLSILFPADSTSSLRSILS